MELWIRSQDKEKLLKCDDIALVKRNWYEIVGYFDKGTEYEVLGVYENYEKALSVLNEIQNHINNNYADVFEIPEE